MKDQYYLVIRDKFQGDDVYCGRSEGETLAEAVRKLIFDHFEMYFIEEARDRGITVDEVFKTYMQNNYYILECAFKLPPGLKLEDYFIELGSGIDAGIPVAIQF